MKQQMRVYQHGATPITYNIVKKYGITDSQLAYTYMPQTNQHEPDGYMWPSQIAPFTLAL